MNFGKNDKRISKIIDISKSNRLINNIVRKAIELSNWICGTLRLSSSYHYLIVNEAIAFLLFYANYSASDRIINYYINCYVSTIVYEIQNPEYYGLNIICPRIKDYENVLINKKIPYTTWNFNNNDFDNELAIMFSIFIECIWNIKNIGVYCDFNDGNPIILHDVTENISFCVFVSKLMEIINLKLQKIKKQVGRT